MKTAFKVLALLLAVLMMVPFFVACKDEGDTSSTASTTSGTSSTTSGDDVTDLDAVSTKTAPAAVIPDYAGGETLVAGYDRFSQKFSPFFSKTAYDQDAYALTQIPLLGSDREGNVVLMGKDGETIPFNGTDYEYKGIANCVVDTSATDGSVVYKFELRDDIFFSDGVNLTADDAIFSMYALSDPAYDGSSTFYAVPIKGMEDYRKGMEVLSGLIIKDGPDATETSPYYTDAQRTAFWTGFTAAGVKLAQEIVDYVREAVGDAELSVAKCAAMWAYGDLAEDATVEDFFAAIRAAYSDSISGIDAEKANTSFYDLLAAEIGDSYPDYEKAVSTGESAANISGIVKTGMYSFEVTTTEFSATTIYQLTYSVAPLHYYGSRDNYKYSENKFGFEKGDLSTIRSKTTVPMGAGPYKFISYEAGVISYERNTTYYLGCPKIKNVRFQETTSANKVTGVESGTFDVTDPSFSDAVITAIKEKNSNGELTGSLITTNAVDNLGYGYIGINANNVKVGDDSSSDASKNLRKGFATLFAVYRDTVIDSYYGDRASVIQYPISNTSWAAPKPADADYNIAYSKDVEGKPIFTDSMSVTEKEAAAVQAAIGFFKAAGYTYDEGSKKFTAAPAGASMKYTIIIPADGIGDHPSYGILEDAEAALSKMGITLVIDDPADSNELWTAIEAGECEMWAAAWGATPDPDMYQVYHSSNVVGKGGTDSNHYAITDDNLDALILEARTSADRAFRKATYKECLETILDWGVEIPTYQRQNALIFSTERIKIDTLTPDITTYWGWMNDIESVEMN